MKVLLRCIFKAQFINSANASLFTAVEDMTEMRSNTVCAEEPADVEMSNERRDNSNIIEFADNDKKNDAEFLQGSLTAAEAVQANTDGRRGLEVTKTNLGNFIDKHILC